jgi:hypothetical protein
VAADADLAISKQARKGAVAKLAPRAAKNRRVRLADDFFKSFPMRRDNVSSVI